MQALPPSRALLQAPPQPPLQASSQSLVEKMNPEILKILLEYQFIKDCENDLTFIFVLILLIYFLEDPKHSEFLSSYNYNNDFPYLEEISFITGTIPNITVETGCIISKIENDYIVLSMNAKFLRVTPDKISQKLNSYNLNLTKYRNSLQNVLYLLFIKYVSNKTRQQIDVKKLLPQVIFDMNNLNTEQHVLKTEESDLKESFLKEMLKIFKKMIYNFNQTCPEFDIAELDQKLDINLHASIQKTLNIKKYIEDEGVKFSNTIKLVEQDFKFLIPPFTVMLNYTESDSGTIDLIDIACKIYKMDTLTVVKDLNKIKSFFNTRYFFYFNSLNIQEINNLASSLGIQFTKGGSKQKTRKFKIRKSKTHKFKEYKPKTRKFKPKTRKLQRGGNLRMFLTTIIIAAIFVMYSNAFSGIVVSTGKSNAARALVENGGLFFDPKIVAESTGLSVNEILSAKFSSVFYVTYNGRPNTPFYIKVGTRVNYDNGGSVLAFLDKYVDDYDDYETITFEHYQKPINTITTTPVKGHVMPPTEIVPYNNNLLDSFSISDVNAALAIMRTWQSSENIQQFMIKSAKNAVLAKASQLVAAELAVQATYFLPGLVGVAGQVTPLMPVINAAILINQVYSLVTYDPVLERQKIIQLEIQMKRDHMQEQYNDMLINMVSSNDFITTLVHSNNMLGDMYFLGGVNFQNIHQFYPVYEKMINKIKDIINDASKNNDMIKLNHYVKKYKILNDMFLRSFNDFGKYDHKTQIKIGGTLKSDDEIKISEVIEQNNNNNNGIYYQENSGLNTDVWTAPTSTRPPRQITATPQAQRQRNMRVKLSSFISPNDMFYFETLSESEFNLKKQTDKYGSIYTFKSLGSEGFKKYVSKMSIENYKEYISNNFDGNGNVRPHIDPLKKINLNNNEIPAGWFGYKYDVHNVDEARKLANALQQLKEPWPYDFMRRNVPADAAWAIVDFIKDNGYENFAQKFHTYADTLPPDNHKIKDYKDSLPEKVVKQLYDWKKSLFSNQEVRSIREWLSTVSPDTTITNIETLVSLTKHFVSTVPDPSDSTHAKIKKENEQVTGSPNELFGKIRSIIFDEGKNKKIKELTPFQKSLIDFTNNMPENFNSEYQKEWNRLEQEKWELNETERKKMEAEEIKKVERNKKKANKNLQKAKDELQEAKDEFEEAEKELEEAEKYKYKLTTFVNAQKHPKIGPRPQEMSNQLPTIKTYSDNAVIPDNSNVVFSQTVDFTDTTNAVAPDGSASSQYVNPNIKQITSNYNTIFGDEINFIIFISGVIIIGSYYLNSEIELNVEQELSKISDSKAKNYKQQQQQQTATSTTMAIANSIASAKQHQQQQQQTATARTIANSTASASAKQAQYVYNR
jgi:hypothetical protein